jgi:predicted site-specific integrase-resolvase
MRGNIIEQPSRLAGGNLCTRQDVARLFKVCPGTVSRWARAGHIQVIHLGSGKVRYDFPSVLSYLALR